MKNVEGEDNCVMTLSTVWTINSRTKINLLGCEKRFFYPKETSRFIPDDEKMPEYMASHARRQ
jgi:hypothetical protein